MENVEELERALEYPWERWIVFLHPAQREIVERDYSGPARVSGSAGTGKTIVALHRAVFLARANPEARILLTTYSDMLASALRSRLELLIRNEPRIAERIEVHSISAVGRRLYRAHAGEPRIASREDIERFIREASEAAEPHRFRLHFLVTEWEQVVDAWQLRTWDDYRDVRRLGRKTRSTGATAGSPVVDLRAGQPTGSTRRTCSPSSGCSRGSPICSLTDRDGPTTSSSWTRRRTWASPTCGSSPRWRRIVRTLCSLPAISVSASSSSRSPGASLGVDIRGRSRNLHVNYRTSHQIRQSADRLLDPEQTDADGITESRAGTVSVFNGAPPEIRVLDDEELETEAVAEWIRDLAEDGVAPDEFGVFVRSEAEIERALSAVDAAGLASVVLDENVRTTRGSASVSTMHLAKGLEFRAVVVMACDDEVIPSQERIEMIADSADLEDVYKTERHLLYVACTRARDHLLVTGVAPASEFLEDLGATR